MKPSMMSSSWHPVNWLMTSPFLTPNTVGTDLTWKKRKVPYCTYCWHKNKSALQMAQSWCISAPYAITMFNRTNHLNCCDPLVGRKLEYSRGASSGNKVIVESNIFYDVYKYSKKWWPCQYIMKNLATFYLSKCP